MSKEALAWARSQPLTGKDHAFLIRLGDSHFKDTGQCSRSLKFFMRELGCSRPTLTKSRRRLRALRLIDFKDGGAHADSYTLHLDRRVTEAEVAAVIAQEPRRKKPPTVGNMFPTSEAKVSHSVGKKTGGSGKRGIPHNPTTLHEGAAGPAPHVARPAAPVPPISDIPFDAARERSRERCAPARALAAHEHDHEARQDHEHDAQPEDTMDLDKLYDQPVPDLLDWLAKELSLTTAQRPIDIRLGYVKRWFEALRPAIKRERPTATAAEIERAAASTLFDIVVLAPGHYSPRLSLIAAVDAMVREFVRNAAPVDAAPAPSPPEASG